MMKKLIMATTLALYLVVHSTLALANTEEKAAALLDRPANDTPGLPPVQVGPSIDESTPMGQWAILYPEPSTINVSIYELDSNKAEDMSRYIKTVTVDFETYVKDSQNNANVTNGTRSQVYIPGSNKPNCNRAVEAVDTKVIGVSGDTKGTIYETGYSANASDEGTRLSQNGSYRDALDGNTYYEIIDHWYREYNLEVRDQLQYVSGPIPVNDDVK